MLPAHMPAWPGLILAFVAMFAIEANTRSRAKAVIHVWLAKNDLSLVEPGIAFTWIMGGRVRLVAKDKSGQRFAFVLEVFGFRRASVLEQPKVLSVKQHSK